MKPWSGVKSSQCQVHVPPPQPEIFLSCYDLEILGRVFQHLKLSTKYSYVVYSSWPNMSGWFHSLNAAIGDSFQVAPGVKNWSLGKMWLGVVERREVVTQLPPHPPKKWDLSLLVFTKCKHPEPKLDGCGRDDCFLSIALEVFKKMERLWWLWTLVEMVGMGISRE